jgi:hypothetical protein
MRGTWLAAVASRVLRDETYHLTAAPAIADLQFERSTRWRDYLAIWGVIGRSAIGDVWTDLRDVFGPRASHGVWRQLLGLYVLFFVVRAFSRVSEGIRFMTPDMPRGTFRKLALPPVGDGLEPYLAGLLLSAALTCVAYAALPAVFMLIRRHTPARAIVLAVLCIGSLTYGTARLSRSIAEQSSFYSEAVVIRGAGARDAATPLAQVVAEDVIPRRQAPPPPPHPDMHRKSRTWTEISNALNVLVYALIGAALAQGRSIGVLGRFVGIMAMSAVLGYAVPFIGMLLWPIGTPQPPPVTEQILDFLILPILACVFLAMPAHTNTAGPLRGPRPT